MDAFAYSAVRTPFGRFDGAFARPDGLATLSTVLRARYGAAAARIGVGQGVATVPENLQVAA